MRPIQIAAITLLLSVAPALSATWTNINNSQSIGSFFGIAGTSSETVAVGIDGRISTRNNSTGTWTIQTFTGNPDFRDVIYANGQYVTVREGGGVMTSLDGLSWTNHSSGTTNDLRALLWDGSSYFAAGQNGTILNSTDGSTWTARTSGVTTFFNSISYSGSRYVAAGGFGIRVSSDGFSWSAPTVAPPSISFEASTWTGSQFIVGGLGFGSTATLYGSVDGLTWSLLNSTIKDNVESAITVGGVTYITGAINGGGNGFVYSSTDGTNWQSTYPTPNGGEFFMDITTNGTSLIAAGFNHNVHSTAVPEPGALSLLVAALGFFCSRRTRSNHALQRTAP
jgi:hypothetical protein